jgi:FkbM family methyltransferase
MSKKIYSRIKASVPAQWFFKHSGLGQLRVYVRWFGWIGAFKVLWAKPFSPAEPVRINHPQLKAPVFLRAASSDPYIYAEVLFDQVYECRLAAQPRLIIDAGANIGLASVFFSNRYPEAQVVAIEPAETNMRLLRRNVAPYPNVHPKLAGLWPIPGPLRLIDSNAEAWAIQVQPCQPEEADFQGITIPDILKEYQMEQIDLLKIDIEGAEWPLFFDTPPDWLHSVNFLIIELHKPPGKTSFDHIVQLLETYHLKQVKIDGGNYAFSR